MSAEPLPIIDPQLEADLEAWMAAEAQFEQDKEALLKMLLFIGTMANPLIGAQMVMMQMMQIQGDKVGALATISNVASDIRSEVTGEQGDMNAQGGDSDSQAVADMQKFLDSIDGMEAFLKSQLAQGKGSVIDPADINNMVSALDSIKNQFGAAWGNAADMAGQVSVWVNETKHGESSPELSAILSAFQELNQSTSALSTTTTTQLQYTAQVFQQIEGITNETMQLYQKLVTGFVNNQNTR